MRVLVHGGAGGTPEDPGARRETLDEAAKRGCAGSTPVGAVERAVRHLESAPAFNAGVGGARQSDGVVRTDAGIMRGGGETGAACSLRGVEHAVSVARGVLERTPHVLLAGDRAVAFAQALGVDVDVDLRTERTRDRWGEYDPPEDVLEQLEAVWERFDGADRGRGRDTVGAVATDGRTVASATSTGGRWFALAGRVGDVPQVGGGFYATTAAAASTTGEGEEIARFGLARDVVERIEDGTNPGDAADRAIEAFEDETGANGGAIAVDATGGLGCAYNSEAMLTGHWGSITGDSSRE